MELSVLNINEVKTVGYVDWNYKELKTQVCAAMEDYNGIIVTEENFKDCKAKRAKLRKFYTALESARKSIKAEINAPYEKFKNELEDVEAPVTEQIENLDKQIKAIEDAKKEPEMQRTICKYEVTVPPDMADTFEKYLKRNNYEYKILA